MHCKLSEIFHGHIKALGRCFAAEGGGSRFNQSCTARASALVEVKVPTLRESSGVKRPLAFSLRRVFAAV